MQRLASAAPIDDSTLATYEETVAIIHRHLPPSLALLYATARRGTEGHLEWWTERQGLATPLTALSEAEQLAVQHKRQQYQDTLTGLIDQLADRGEDKSVQALRLLLTHSQGLTCYGVGGEPVLINWVIPAQQTVQTVVSPPWWRRLLPWLLLLLFILLLAFAWWWYRHHDAAIPALPIVDETPAVVSPEPPTHTELTQDNPSVSITNRKDFGQIKVNLTWQQGTHKKPIDLDLAAFIRFKNADKSGVEALSQYLGHYNESPYMLLKEDLRNGNNQDGEWLFINGSHWQDIDEILIYSFIYDGAKNWQGTHATITLYIPDQPPISSDLVNSNSTNSVAAIARLKNVDGDIKVERLDNFFRDRKSLDEHFGWGFIWKPGASKN